MGVRRCKELKRLGEITFDWKERTSLTRTLILVIYLEIRVYYFIVHLLESVGGSPLFQDGCSLLVVFRTGGRFNS